jgi:hypothetical protein
MAARQNDVETGNFTALLLSFGVYEPILPS